MNRGYVKLWRKSLDRGLLKKHKVWAFFTYCLLKATHKSCIVIIGNQEVTLEPGQFVFGRRTGAEETGLTEREIRTCIESLAHLGILTIKSTNKFSVITIVNWRTYQSSETENDQQSDQVPTSNRPHTRTKEQKKYKNTESLSGEFSSLLERYSDHSLIKRAFEAIASTRKLGKVSKSILIAQLQSWGRYPVEQVEAGIRIYLDNGYASQGKREEYLLGIIRNQNPKETKGGDQEPRFIQSTGSPLFDDAIRNPQKYRPTE